MPGHMGMPMRPGFPGPPGHGGLPGGLPGMGGPQGFPGGPPQRPLGPALPQKRPGADLDDLLSKPSLQDRLKTEK